MSDERPPRSGEPTIRLQSTPSDERPDSAVAMASGPRRLVLDEQVKDAIDADVGSDTSVERGGVLVGDRAADGSSLEIVASVPAKYAVGRAASLRFTHETWEYVNDVISDEHPDLRMVGWYHSHPGFGIFLSEYDTFIHQNFFSAPWQVAYVVDPLLGQAGFFGWEAGQIVRYRNWHLLAHGSARAVREPVRGPDPGPAIPPTATSAAAPETPAVSLVPEWSGAPGGVEAPGTTGSAPPRVSPWAVGLASGLIGLLGGVAVGHLVQSSEAKAGGPSAVPSRSVTRPVSRVTPPLQETFDLTVEGDEDTCGVDGGQITMDRTWALSDLETWRLDVHIRNDTDCTLWGDIDGCAPEGWQPRLTPADPAPASRCLFRALAPGASQRTTFDPPVGTAGAPGGSDAPTETLWLFQSKTAESTTGPGPTGPDTGSGATSNLTRSAPNTVHPAQHDTGTSWRDGLDHGEDGS